MISRIKGELVAIEGGRLELRCGPLTYTLLVPAADEPHLASRLGEHVELHTLHYLESQGQGATYVPRLLGFSCAGDRAFFELLTTVRGMGARRTLKVLRLPAARIAEAIANKDIDLLTTLPEIGRRTAETIVADLHGRVDRLRDDGAGPPPNARAPVAVRDAVAALVELGEPKPKARQLVEQALNADPSLESADALAGAAYRLREN